MKKYKTDLYVVTVFFILTVLCLMGCGDASSFMHAPNPLQLGPAPDNTPSKDKDHDDDDDDDHDDPDHDDDYDHGRRKRR